MSEGGPDRSAIAIVGIACTYPGARNAAQFWQNIVGKVDSVTDVQPDRWDPAVFYNPDPAAEGRVYCKKGGWMEGSYAFNPLKYGIMPSALEGTEADHFLVLRAAQEALEDAGYGDGKLDGSRVGIILGKGNYTGPGVTALMYRSIVAEQILAILKGLHPEFTEQDLARLKAAVRDTVPPLTPEGAAGLIPNICTGRVANRLGLMGRNFTVDAACASSLIATEIAVQDLRSGQADLVLAGGVHVFAHIPFLLVFDAMRALSLGSTIRPFDEECDGTMSGEGVGILALKRLADAERDGDRIYALIRGCGSSSDGRAKGIVAPRPEGEELALRRAFENSGIDASTVELIEAHGTGTAAGDVAEVEALRRVWGEHGREWASCAVGTVKSMIGHAMPAAGAAGMIKAALSLYHSVLPPTLNCRNPRAALVGKGSPFYVNSETRPWVHTPATPRRAGVNAFGFGGINAHVVLEEYAGSQPERASSLLREWPSEFVTLRAPTTAGLVQAAETLRAYAQAAQGVSLRDIAFTLNTGQAADASGKNEQLTVVAASLDDLCRKLEQVPARLRDAQSNAADVKDRQGIYWFQNPELRDGKVAFLFPGEGSQYLNMLSELCLHFPEVRQVFDKADAAGGDASRRPASSLIFPPPAFSEAETKQQEERLFGIERATEAVLTTDSAVFKLLDTLGVQADMMAGHSAGEWIALAAAGVVDTNEFISSLDRLAKMYGSVAADAQIPVMSMLAVGAGSARVQQLVRELDRRAWIANDNCPHQVVIVVKPEDEAAVFAQLQRNDVFVEKLPYDRGYHTPAFTYICEPLRAYFSSLNIGSPLIPLYSCTTAEPYPREADKILDTVADTFARPLLFRDTIEAMYRAGARIFVEAGPRGNLTAFVDDILRGRPHLSIPIDQYRRGGILTLNHALAMMVAAGVPLNAAPLYSRRAPRRLTFNLSEDRVADPDSMPGTVRISLNYPRLGIPDALPAPAVSAAPFNTLQNGISHDLPQFETILDSPMDYAISSSLMDDHVAVMEEMLRTHEEVMLASLGSVAGNAARPVHRNGHSPSPLPVQQPARQLSQVEYEKPPSQQAPVPISHAPVNHATPSSPAPAAAQPVAVNLTDILLRIVTDRTGYPVEMLGLDMDMEADLGIDSIKRVEILGGLSEAAASANLQGDVDIEAVAKLRTLREVVQFFEAAGNPAKTDPQELLRRSPLIRASTIAAQEAGKSIKLRCSIAPGEHLYLQDHCLYFQASDHGSQASPLLSIPMTGSLEIMAETAALLSPGQLVVGAKDVQALKWINVKQDAPEVVLFVRAKRIDTKSVMVTIWPETSGPGEPAMSDVLAQATILFDDQYPAPPEVKSLALTNAREPVLKGKEVYTEHLMFHGPRFQGISNVEQMGDNGVRGALTVLPTGNLLRSDPAPVFHIDPFLLDAAGQMVGYWPCEYLEEGYVVLPIRIARIALYRKNPAPSSPIACQVRMGEVSRRQLRGDIDLIAPDGGLWMRVTGWEDWRFYWEKQIHDFWRFPERALNGRAVSFPWLEQQGMVCQRIDPMSEMDKSGLWEVLWMHMILDRAELSEYQAIHQPEARARWIFERATAKDAVRRWAKEQYGIQIFPADVHVEPDTSGVLQASGAWSQLVKNLPSVSACLHGTFGFGMAGPRLAGLGVVNAAAEEQGAAGLTRPELTRAELALIEAAGGSGSHVRALAAKQAATHLLRLAGHSTYSVAITGFHPENGCVELQAQDPHSSASISVTAECHHSEDAVIAAAISQEVSSPCK